VVSLAASASLQEIVLTAADPDREIAERFQQGERGAFDQLVKRHQQGMYRVVRRYVHSDADAADVCQQSFVRAFKGLATFRGAASVRSWLYRIGINCALSWLRDHKREQPAEIAEDALTEMNHAPARLADGERSAARRDRAAAAEAEARARAARVRRALVQGGRRAGGVQREHREGELSLRGEEAA